MNTNKTYEKLLELTKGQVSNWHEEAKYRQQNRKWLRYSGSVALRILAAIKNIEGMNQKKLADMMGVSQQQISKIIKGHENLTLETIGKLSEALGVELISFPEFRYSKPSDVNPPKKKSISYKNKMEKFSIAEEPATKYRTRTGK